MCITMIVVTFDLFYLCSIAYVTPFVLGVNFDNQEFCEESGDGAATTTPDRCEGVGEYKI